MRSLTHRDLSYPKSLLSGMWVPVLAKMWHGFPYSSSFLVKDDNVNAFVGFVEKTHLICPKSLACLFLPLSHSKRKALKITNPDWQPVSEGCNVEVFSNMGSSSHMWQWRRKWLMISTLCDGSSGTLLLVQKYYHLMYYFRKVATVVWIYFVTSRIKAFRSNR